MDVSSQTGAYREEDRARVTILEAVSKSNTLTRFFL